MKRMVMWLVNRVKRLFGQSGSCQVAAPSEAIVPLTSAQTPAEVTGTPASGALVNNEQASLLFDQTMKELRLHEKRIFRTFARPVGFKGSDVICEVTKRYAIGTRITRTDGRVYEVYRVKKTKRMRIEALSPIPIWRVLA